MASSSSSSDGVGVVGLLGVVFVVLKLTGYINWSWWYVTMPFWAGLAILASIGIIAGFIFLIAHIAGTIKKRRKYVNRRP
jgi:predicted membrane protein